MAIPVFHVGDRAVVSRPKIHEDDVFDFQRIGTVVRIGDRSFPITVLFDDEIKPLSIGSELVKTTTKA